MGLQWVTRDNSGLQGITVGYRGYVTRGHRRLHRATWGYKKLQGVTRGYKGSQGVTGAHEGLQGVKTEN